MRRWDRPTGSGSNRRTMTAWRARYPADRTAAHALAEAWLALGDLPQAGSVYAELLRGRPDGRRRLNEIQATLSAMTGLGAHSVLLYCPPIKMQAKAVGMPVRFEDRKVVPLGNHPDFRVEAEQLNGRYQSLWKAFAFVHPAVLRSPGLVGRVVGEFCRRLDIPASYMPRIIATDYMMEEQGEGPIA